jgi:colanic acid biosynthesis glycosyl transferase WcaI
LAEDGVGLVFVGDGAQRESLQRKAGDAKNVRFLSFFPASKIASVLAAGDIHLVTIKHGLEGVVVPSKMYGILAAGKPIVAAAPGECDVVAIGREKGFSVSADPDKPGELVAAIRELSGDSIKLQQMGEAAALAAPAYERKRELAKLVEVVENAAADRQSISSQD